MYIPCSIRKADQIIAISHSTKTDIEHCYPQAKEKIEVIHNAIQFSKYDSECEYDDVDSDYFLAISNNANYKNQKTILRSYRYYKEQGGDKRLVIIGILSTKSEAYSEFVSLPQTIKDDIIWKSGVSNKELGFLYRHAACFISASKFEGLGMPVIEAMSFGLPVVLSDIPVHHEVSHEQGVYFSPTDVDKLTSIMKNMDFQKRNYAEMIRSKYSDDNTSARYVELINRMWKR